MVNQLLEAISGKEFTYDHMLGLGRFVLKTEIDFNRAARSNRRLVTDCLNSLRKK